MIQENFFYQHSDQYKKHPYYNLHPVRFTLTKKILSVNGELELSLIDITLNK